MTGLVGGCVFEGFLQLMVGVMKHLSKSVDNSNISCNGELIIEIVRRKLNSRNFNRAK